jgi:class 3 adenylate cyclase/tetratricopeptide (TPR) repeat protein
LGESESLVTVLFTDVEGSTDVFARLGDAGGWELVSAVERLTRERVAEFGGRVVKSVGDGVLAVFESARRSLACAVAIQQGLVEGSLAAGPRVRIGINSGDVLADGEDLQGAAVALAARITAEAEGGQILVSDVVRQSSGLRPGVGFVDRGWHRLKGFPGKVQLFEVTEHQTDRSIVTARELVHGQAEPRARGVSAREQRVTGAGFVGRAIELEELCHACDEAIEGRGQLVLIGGDAGIGKTRLAEEVRGYASARGAQVLWASAWRSSGAPAYWPWIQLMRAWAGSEPSGAAGVVPNALGSLVPELAVPEDGEPRAELDADRARFQLFDAVTSWFAAAAEKRPLVLVLDDLQWADASSLLLLGFVARQLQGARMLVVGTYRDTALSEDADLSHVLAELSRNATRIVLGGLGEPEVAELAAKTAGVEVGSGLVSSLHERTRGNPFFVRELTRLLAVRGLLADTEAGHAEVPLPAGVREVLAARLAALSPTTRQVLAAASVVGTAFDLTLLISMTGLEQDQVLEALDEAIHARVVLSPRVGDYEFAHALFRDVLYDSHSTSARVQLHRLVGETIEAQFGVDLRSHLAELADHFRRAVPSGTLEKAIEYSRQAGGAAEAAFAYEDAVVDLEAALALMEEHNAEPARRAGLLAALGHLMFTAGLDRARGIRCQERALAIYEELGDTRRTVRMHAGLGSAWSMYPDADVDIMDIPKALVHLRAAEDMLSQNQPGIDLQLVYAMLSNAACYGMCCEESVAAADRAVEVTETIDEPPAGAVATSQLTLGLRQIERGQLAVGRRVIEEAWETADRLQHPVAAFYAAWGLGAHLVFLLDPAPAMIVCQRELAKARTAQAPGQRWHLLTFLAMSHALCGQLSKARHVVEPLAGDQYVEPLLALWSGDWDAGREALLTDLDRLHRTGDRFNEWRQLYWLGRLERSAGNHDGAERALRDGLSIALDGPMVLAELSIRGELALLCDETDEPDEAQTHVARCQQILAEGQDWRGLAGRARLAAGSCAATAGQSGDATQEFQAARRAFRECRLPFDEAEVLHRWGEHLHDTGDRGGGQAKFEAARALALRHDAGGPWVERVLAEPSGSSVRGDTLDDTTSKARARSRSASVFRQEGEYWTVAYHGHVVRLRDAKGLHHLSELLTRPGHEIHVLELVAAREGRAPQRRAAPERLRGGVAAGSDAGELLDPQAKAAYRQRVTDLEAELEEADDFHDPERASRARAEVDLLTQQLAAAVGLGGRDRRAASTAERARVSVTLALRAALKKVMAAHPDLGAHLADTVRTGQYCSYRPGTLITWQR